MKQRIEMYEKAIQELHDVKMKAIEKTIEVEKYDALINAIQICCLVGMILILA